MFRGRCTCHQHSTASRKVSKKGAEGWEARAARGQKVKTQDDKNMEVRANMRKTL